MKEADRRASVRRGRPRDPAVEQAILEAAIKTLAVEGIDGTSMDKVAAEAGTSKVTISPAIPTRPNGVPPVFRRVVLIGSFREMEVEYHGRKAEEVHCFV